MKSKGRLATSNRDTKMSYGHTLSSASEVYLPIRAVSLRRTCSSKPNMQHGMWALLKRCRLSEAELLTNPDSQTLADATYFGPKGGPI